MPAVLVNTVSVALGSLLGLLLRSRFKENLQTAVMKALALCTLVIGVSGAIASEQILCLILCLAFGTILGECLRIEDGINRMGGALKARFARGENSRFTEGFVTACILFCVGSMTVVGCLEAGVDHHYDLLFAKSLLDFFSSIALSAAMGMGVFFSSVFVLIFQGLLALLAGWIGPFLTPEIITEMSAVGGTIIIGISVNMLELGREPIRVANMLPAIFLPILYIPAVQWLSGLFG